MITALHAVGTHHRPPEGEDLLQLDSVGVGDEDRVVAGAYNGQAAGASGRATPGARRGSWKSPTASREGTAKARR